MSKPLSDDDACIIGLYARGAAGPRALRRLTERARRSGLSLAEFMSLPEDALRERLSARPPIAVDLGSVGDPARAGRACAERMRRAGGDALLAHRSGSPESLLEWLGPDCPPVLFVAGNVGLLGRPCAAMVGSRRPSRVATAAARRLAESLADAGLTVVSGGARGIDTVAHVAAARFGALALCPALGIERLFAGGFDAWGAPEGNWCVVGQFPPRARWRAAQALMRNRTIAALSEIVVAFDPRDTGGTWHTCNHALRMGKPLFVVSSARRGAKARGLRRLVRRGAAALDPARMPSAGALLEMAAEHAPPSPPAQPPLFD